MSDRDLDRNKERATAKLGEASRDVRNAAQNVNKKMSEASEELQKAEGREKLRLIAERKAKEEEPRRSIMGSLGAAVEGVKESIVGAKDFVAEKAHLTKETAKDKVNEMGDKASVKVSEVKEKAEDTVEDMRRDYDETIRQHRARKAYEEHQKAIREGRYDRSGDWYYGRRAGMRNPEDSYWSNHSQGRDEDFNARAGRRTRVDFFDHAGEEPDESFDYPYPVVKSSVDYIPDRDRRDRPLATTETSKRDRYARDIVETYRPAERCSNFDPKRDCENAYSIKQLRQMVRQCAGMHIDEVEQLSKTDLCFAMKKFNAEGR